MSCIAGGNVKWCSHYGKQFSTSSESQTQNYHMTNHLHAQEIHKRIVNKYSKDTCKPMIIAVKPRRTLRDLPRDRPQCPLPLFFFIFNFIYLVAPGLSCSRQAPLVAAHELLSCGMRTLSCSMHVGSISLIRDRTQAPCIGSVET